MSKSVRPSNQLVQAGLEEADADELSEYQL